MTEGCLIDEACPNCGMNHETEAAQELETGAVEALDPMRRCFRCDAFLVDGSDADFGYDPEED